MSKFCTCKSDFKEGVLMIQCDNEECKGQWFHPKCMGFSDEEAKSKNNFFCSKECEENCLKMKKKKAKK